MPDRLDVAVIGAGAGGSVALHALTQTDSVRLVGVSDLDASAAEQATRRHGVPSYVDTRSLLAETRPRAVFVCVPPAEAPDIIFTCAGRGIHIWSELPLARSLDEGLAMVRRMDEADLKFAVGTQRRFADGYRKAHELRSRIGQVFLARAHYMFNWGSELGWRGDRGTTGGGALLELGYHAIDLLTWTIGLPETVYGSQVCGHRPDLTAPDGGPLPVYDTDDSAAALLRYPQNCMGTLVTSRRSGPVSEALSLHGRDGSLTATVETCTLRSPDGDLLESTQTHASAVELHRRQAESFARSVLTDATSYECSARENLLNMAIIEAIYLSDRTGQGESPLRMLKARELDESACLKYAPARPDR